VISDRKGTAIQVVKFSPDNNWCAVGGSDGLVMVYAVKRHFELEFTLQKHQGPVTSIDWSMNSSVFMSLDTKQNLLYFDCRRGVQNTKGMSDYRNESWATWTCASGWPVQGIWPPGADGLDISTVDRCADSSVVAVGDDYGRIKLYNWPATTSEPPCHTYHGHGSYVANLQFSNWLDDDERYLFSVGGSNKCLMQWKLTTEQPAKKMSMPKLTIRKTIKE
jgi:WD40 repeat protein